MKSSNATGGVSHMLERWFPTPRMLTPQSLGIDISDSSIKWLGLTTTAEGKRKVLTYGSSPLLSGIVSGGVVRDPEQLGAALKAIKAKFGGISYAHAALPEEVAYVFGMHVPAGSPRDQVMRLIEFEFEGRVPIQPSAAIYDFDVIEEGDGVEGMEVGVVVFPRDAAESYASAFAIAGIELLSLEIEARSVARAVSAHAENEPTTLMADFGLARTGFALLKNGIPIFTSTVDVGGDMITRSVSEKLGLDPVETERFKNDEGLQTTRKNVGSVMDVMTSTATSLSGEISKHFHYWDTRRDSRGERVTPVGRVLLVGGSSNLKGLADFVASKVQAPVECGDVWRNIATFDDYVPPIDVRTSLQFATAVGLALRGI